MAKTDFIKTYYPYCKKLENAGGLNAVMAVAQAGYEGGWGDSNISKKCNNCFGITTSGSGYKTGPNKYGNYHTWKIFSSLGGCFDYHNTMFSPGHTKISAYQNAYPYRQSDPAKFLKIMAPTYCPSKDGGSNYANNVISIMKDVQAAIKKLGIADSTDVNTSKVFSSNGVSGGSGGSSGGSGTSWASAVQQMGNWYASNISDYNQSGYAQCSLVNKQVRKDCSGFTSACLWLYGVNMSTGSSDSFTATSGSTFNALSGAGFTQMAFSTSTVQPYDIISYNGHVEIYAGNKKSYSWGDVHKSLPCGTADFEKYTKIWRNSDPNAGGSSGDSSTASDYNYDPTDMYTYKDVSVYGDLEDSFADLSKYANEVDIEDGEDYEPLSVTDNTVAETDQKLIEDYTSQVTANNEKVYPPVLTQKMKPSVEISEHSWWATEQDKSEDKGVETSPGTGEAISQNDTYAI